MKAELVKRQDRWDLYGEDGSKIASSAPNPMRKLSLKNCESIANGYDLDGLADEYYKGLELVPHKGNAYISGFKKALEILGDKKFNEKDVRDAYYHGEQDSYMKGGLTKQKEDNYIQSLQQPTEIEVEIEQVLIQSSIQGEAKWEYRLDKNGCLILKRL
jgi:hypothetical protein